jgi:hypothetical protein
LASASFVFKPLRLLKNVGCLAVIYRRQFLINECLFPCRGSNPYLGKPWAIITIATDDKLPAVFRSRAAELNLEEAAIVKASSKGLFKEIFEDPFTEALIKRPLKAIDEKIASLGAFGFCTRYVPGNDDESPLEDLARMLHDLGTTDRLRVDIISFIGLNQP